SVAFSLDGRKIVSGSIDNSVRIWDVETGKAEGNPIQGHTSNVKSVAFSPDGKRIVSGSDDRSVRIWNAETGKPEGNPLQGHGSGVRSVAFSPDGKRIVSGSEDMSVRIWDAETAKAEETDTSSSATVPTSANIKYSLSFCPWHNSHHHLHSSSSLQMVSLQHNGWLCGSDSSLIIWIPPEYRNGLLVPPLQVLISSSHMRSLNLQNFVHGIFWAQCYTGKLFSSCFTVPSLTLKKGCS
ncbi:WD40-repeat-containing domain protein, partial [Rhodocollybia butyracea]